MPPWSCHVMSTWWADWLSPPAVLLAPSRWISVCANRVFKEHQMRNSTNKGNSTSGGLCQAKPIGHVGGHGGHVTCGGQLEDKKVKYSFYDPKTQQFLWQMIVSCFTVWLSIFNCFDSINGIGQCGNGATRSFSTGRFSIRFQCLTATSLNSC